jgi:cytochrome c-type biogenesis protein CcmH/NrfG
VALGRSYLLTGRMDEARAIRSELAELKTRLPADAASFRAEMQLADALDGVKTSSGSAPAHASLGRTLLDLGRWEEGTRALEQALRLDPTRRAYAADLAYGLAPAVRTADLAEGDLSSAVEQAQRECVVGEGARATRSKDFRVWHRLAMLRLRSAVRTGDMASMDRDAAAKCVSALEEAVRSARSGARVNEGAFLGPLGYASARVVAVAGFAYPEAAWDHVLLEALRALLKDPGDAFGLLNLATSLVAVGESATALPALRALRQIRPDDPETDYVAAQMCFAGGDASEAERLTRRVLGSNPRHPRARPLLAQILADGGDWTGAAVLMATHQDMYGRTDPPPSRGTDGAR